MDVIATIITGIIWGIIINVCWISAYLGLLFYHFYKEQNDPLYMSRYERARQQIREGKLNEAIKESFAEGGVKGGRAARVTTSKIRQVITKIKRYWRK